MVNGWPRYASIFQIPRDEPPILDFFPTTRHTHEAMGSPNVGISLWALIMEKDRNDRLPRVEVLFSRCHPCGKRHRPFFGTS